MFAFFAASAVAALVLFLLSSSSFYWTDFSSIAFSAIFLIDYPSTTFSSRTHRVSLSLPDSWAQAVWAAIYSIDCSTWCRRWWAEMFSCCCCSMSSRATTTTTTTRLKNSLSNPRHHRHHHRPTNQTWTWTSICSSFGIESSRIRLDRAFSACSRTFDSCPDQWSCTISTDNHTCSY